MTSDTARRAMARLEQLASHGAQGQQLINAAKDAKEAINEWLSEMEK